MRSRGSRMAAAALVVVLGALGAAGAAEVRDAGRMFGAGAVREAESTLDRAERATGVPILIETVDSLRGQPIPEAARSGADRAGARGVYLLLSKADHRISGVLIHKDSPAARMPQARRDAVRDAMLSEFRGGDFDAGLIRGAELLAAELERNVTSAAAGGGRGGMLPGPDGNLPRPGGAAAPVPAPAPRPAPGPSFGWLLPLIVLVGGFLLVRSLLRRARAGLGGGGMSQPGYGGEAGGYGGGFGGGGGGLFRGILGGLGGALLGNWVYDRMSGGHGHAHGSEPPRDQGGFLGGTGNDYTGSDQGASWGGGGGDWTGNDAGGDWGGGGGDAGGGDW